MLGYLSWIYTNDEILAGQQHYPYSFNGYSTDTENKEIVFKEATP